MEKEKSLIEQKNRNGIGRVFNNVVEFIKSRVSKNYVLSESSPDFLWHNRNLVLKTIKDDFTKLKLVPDDMLLAELQQNSIPTNLYSNFQQVCCFVLNKLLKIRLFYNLFQQPNLIIVF